jgi:ectoine hydroxylase-related dioxygenase (phytanoyl-CoA dioxygenase family)
VTPDDITGALARDGWVIIEGLAPGATVTRVRDALRPVLDATPYGVNSFYGRRTRRAFGLPAKTRALDGLLCDATVTRAIGDALGPVLLSTIAAVEIDPGEQAQALHRDADAWPVGTDAGQIVANAIWALDDFTAENGATRLVSGSHGDPDPPGPDAPVVVAEMPAGAALVYLGTLWHGGGSNASAQARLGLIVGYTVSWLRQQENFTLTCPPDLARGLDPRLQRLLGYSLHEPFVGHVDGRDPAELLG